MKKILWIGEYTNPTGFSRVCKSIIKNLPEGKYDITFLDYQKTLPPTALDNGITLMGTIDNQDLNGFRTLKAINLDNFDAIMMVNDVWGLDLFLEILHQRGWKKPVVVYFPVDAERHDADWYKHFDMVSQAVTYTGFGYRVATEAAPQLVQRLEIIPHGVDTDVFYKIDAPLEEIRKKAYGTDRFSDGVIFLNANRNMTRKRLDITIEAFSIFAKDKRDAWLHMHCGNTDNSMNVHKLALRTGVGDRIILTGGPKYHGQQRIPDEQLNYLFNAAQVGLNSSLGEGWGLTNVEHAAAGGIQIVPNHSACKEVHADHSLLIKSPTPYTFDKIMTVGYLPDIHDMAKQMNFAYGNVKDGSANKMVENCVKTFTSEPFLWKTIGKRWDSIFSNLP